MNFVTAEVVSHKGKTVRLALTGNGQIELQARNGLAGMTDTRLEIGIRPEHIHLVARTNAPVRCQRKRRLTVFNLWN